MTDTWQAVQALMRFVKGHLDYKPASTHVHTPLSDALAQGAAFCQDFAHLTLGLCRTLKIPARYVSGYLAVEKARATPCLVEVWIPTVGWLTLDKHNQQIDHKYVEIEAGRVPTCRPWPAPTVARANARWRSKCRLIRCHEMAAR